VLGLLSAVDVSPLAAYCQAYSRWRQAEEALARVASHDPAMHGLLVRTAEGNVRANPLARLSASAASDVIRYAGEFGMTAAARARIAAGPLRAAARRQVHGVSLLSRARSGRGRFRLWCVMLIGLIVGDREDFRCTIESFS